MKKLNMPAKKYHSVKALSSTGISTLITETSSKFKLKFIDGVQEKKSCYAIGSAFHSLVLEPDNFDNEFLVTNLDARTKTFKELSADNPDMTILKQADFDTVKLMRHSIMNNPTAAKLLNFNGEAEASYFWKDKPTGIKCKARLDKLLPDYKGKIVIVDLKTTADASAAGFERSMANYGYHRQAAWYSHAVANNIGKSPALYVIIAVEKTPPFDNACYIISREEMETGWSECRQAIDVYKKCLADESWPGYPNGLTELHLPKWYNKA
jgi:hypothetical protein